MGMCSAGMALTGAWLQDWGAALTPRGPGGGLLQASKQEEEGAAYARTGQKAGTSLWRDDGPAE